MNANPLVLPDIVWKSRNWAIHELYHALLIYFARVHVLFYRQWISLQLLSWWCTEELRSDSPASRHVNTVRIGILWKTPRNWEFQNTFIANYGYFVIVWNDHNFNMLHQKIYSVQKRIKLQKLQSSFPQFEMRIDREFYWSLYLQYFYDLQFCIHNQDVFVTVFLLCSWNSDMLKLNYINLWRKLQQN